MVTGPLGDTKLLAISRKLVGRWYDLGMTLGVLEDDLNEIQAAEQGYQAAFKMLWGWRDEVRESGSDGVDTLVSALETIGASELVPIIQANLPISSA